MNLDSAVSQVSQLSDDELVQNLVHIERAYLHYLIEASLRGHEPDPDKRVVGVVQRLRSV